MVARLVEDAVSTLDMTPTLAGLAGIRASSLARRQVVYKALRHGAYYPWDYQPLQKASVRYMRN